MLTTQRFPAPSGTQALASCSCGAITLCGCCGELEITFGNAVIHADTDSFCDVRDAIHRLIGTPVTTADIRPYLLVLDQPAAFAFSAEELFDLARLVEDAFTELSQDPSNMLLGSGRSLTANSDYA